LKLLKLGRSFEEGKASTKLSLQKKKLSNSIQNSQAGRRRFDPGRPLQNPLENPHSEVDFWRSPKTQEYLYVPRQKWCCESAEAWIGWRDLLSTLGLVVVQFKLHHYPNL
jgi:hypothetical protein